MFERAHRPRRPLGRIRSCLAMLLATPLLVGAQGLRTDLDARLLASQNRERAAMGVPALRWNADLAAGARAWAEHLAATGRFEHSPDYPGEAPLGENIWGGTPGWYAPEAMVGLWIDEKRLFEPGVFPRNSTTGNVHDVSHYTQLVWRRTGEVGCALARGAREEILVCRYAQPGNVYGTSPL